MTKGQAIALPRARSWGKTDLMLLAMVVIWGINYSVIKVALQFMPPFAFNALRFALATLVMLILLKRRGESLRVARRDLPALILVALTGHAVYQIFFISGLDRTSAANAAVLLASMPIWVAIYGQLFGIEHANRTVWAGILLSFVGIIVLILGSGKEFSLGGSTLAGDLMILCATLLWAAYSTISKPLLARYSPVKLTTLEMLMGTPILILVGLPGLVSQNWQQVPAAAWAGVLYSAVLATVVGYVIWSIGIQRTGSARTAIYSNLTPVVAAAAAWFMLGDRIQPVQVLGAVIVFAGLMLTRRGKTS